MQNWFFSKEGRAQGPRSKEQMDEMFKSGLLLAEDLIFREGEREWKKALEFAEFKTVASMEHKGSEPLNLASGTWVLLSKNLEDTQPGRPRFTQTGPFQKEEIIQKIKAGEAHWGDYVWKQGFKSWARVSSLPEFNESLEFVKEKQKVDADNEPTQEFLLNNVVRQVHSQKEVKLAEPPPIEAKPENLAKSFVDLTPEAAKPVAASVPVPTPAVVAPVAVVAPTHLVVATETEVTQPGIEAPAPNPEPSRKRFLIPKIAWTQKRLMLYGGTFAVIAIILSLSLLVPPKTETAEEREPAAVAPASVEAAPAAPVAAAPVVPPPVEKFLRIVPLKLESDQPQLVFETHAGPGEPISIEIKGRQGQILEKIRIDRSTQVARAQNEVPTLNLAKWDLPQGTYTVEAKVAGVAAKTEIFVGQKNRAFQTLLNKHNQKIAIQAKAEKQDLDASLKKFEKQIQNLQKGYAANKKNSKKWSAFYSGWSKEFNSTRGLVTLYKEGQSEKFVHVKAIESSKAIFADIGKSGKALNESVKSKRSPASSVDLKALKAKIAEARRLY